MRVLATTGHPELGSRRQATKNGRIPLSFLATSAASNRIQAEYESGWELRVKPGRIGMRQLVHNTHRIELRGDSLRRSQEGEHRLTDGASEAGGQAAQPLLKGNRLRNR